MSDDVSNEFYLRSGTAARSLDVQEMEEYLRNAQASPEGATGVTIPVSDPGKMDPGRPLPPAKPLRTTTGDVHGRPEGGTEGTAGKVVRNIAEVPGQALAGVDDAARNALGFLDPLTNWLNANVADLRYGKLPEAQTGTGAITRKVSEFLTGFIPAMRGLKTIGVTNAIGAPMLAGAIADFTVRDPHEGRLADLWKEAGLPDNVLTDYLASDENDSAAEARFKNALEGVGLGTMFEGVMLGARALRSARAMAKADPNIVKAEEDYLRARYGDVPDEEYKKIVGDPSKPAVEISVRKPSPAGQKVAAAVEEGKDIAPRAVIRMKGRGEGSVFYRGEGAGVVPPGGRNSMGTWVSTDKAKASRYGTVSEYDPVRTYDFSDARINDELSKAAGFKIERPMDINASIDEQSPGARAIIDVLKKRGYDAVKANDQEAGIFVFNPEKLRPRGSVLPEDFEVYINFARIDSSDQVKFTIGKMAEAFKSQIDEARRGAVTEEQTKAMAESLGMTVPELLARRKGQALNAEEALAARQLWIASGESLLAAAKKAAGPNAGALDQFAFRRQMAIHNAIQQEVLGARAEAGRALNAWKIEAKGGVERARAINQVMEAMGGSNTSVEIARRVALLAEYGDPVAVAKAVERGWGATSVDAIKEVWINGLLSSPKTHMVNITSNTLVAAQQIYERAAAGAIRSFTGGEGVVPGEAFAMAHGMVESIKDAFRLSALALKTGESGWAFNKIDMARTKAISSEAFRMRSETAMGRFVDFLGTVTNVPGRLLGAEDEFFRTIGYRMNLRAEALRVATNEGHTGAALQARYKELIDNPTESLRINSADAALYQTFTNEMGAFGKAIMNLRNAGGDKNWMNPIVFAVPFVRTPVNIARYAFERTPFAPLVSQWRADIAAGGARADLALARMSTGTMIMAMALDMADKGIVTGDGPRGEDKGVREALQRQGWQPYSLKIGDRWYSYNRTDPFGMTMGFAASMAEAVKKGELDQDDVDEWWEVTAMAIAAVSQVSISKTYMEGFARLIEAASDPKRYTREYVQDTIASFTPAASLNSAVKNIVDPVQREAGSPAEAVMARIAGLSDKLPPRRNLWGEPITSESGLGKVYDFMSPVASKPIADSPIDREMVRLGAGPARIDKRSTVDGVQANFRFYPQAYDDYVRLAGNELKHPAWGMGAKDYLNAVVSGNHPMSAQWKILSDESRKAFIQSTISDYRKLAQRQILGDPKHAGFAREIEQLKQYHRTGKMPYLGD